MYKNCNVGSKMFFKWSSMWGKGFCWKQEIFPLKSHVMWFTEISVTWLQVKLVSCCNLTSIGPLFLHNAKVELVLCSKVIFQSALKKLQSNPPPRNLEHLICSCFVWCCLSDHQSLKSLNCAVIMLDTFILILVNWNFFFPRLIAGTISSFRIDSTYKR